MDDRDILAKLDQMQEQLNSIQELLKLSIVQSLTAELEQGLSINEPRAEAAHEKAVRYVEPFMCRIPILSETHKYIVLKAANNKEIRKGNIICYLYYKAGEPPLKIVAERKGVLKYSSSIADIGKERIRVRNGMLIAMIE